MTPKMAKKKKKKRDFSRGNNAFSIVTRRKHLPSAISQFVYKAV